MWEEDEDRIDRLWEYGSTFNQQWPDASARAGSRAVGPPKFNVGDLVRLVQGAAQMKIVERKADGNGNHVKAEYVSRTRSGYSGNLKWRPERDFVFYNKQSEINNSNKQTENTDMNGKLYQTNEATPRFGTLLVTNSKGQLVLEMKGSAGAVEVFDPKEVTVVTPFTFGVKFQGTGTEYSYLGKEGEVEVGDLLMLDQSPRGEMTIARVTGVNTKSQNATVVFKGVKLVTQRVGG